jgi:hypothetical protein
VGIYDLYIKTKIMQRCESHFMNYLKDMGAENEALNDEDIKLIEKNLSYLMDMMAEIVEEKGDNKDAYAEIIDNIIGFCIMGKMNEARLVRVINEKLKDLKDE